MLRHIIVSAILLLGYFFADAQTPGFIFKTAGTGSAVLDPNGDGYTSKTSGGFVSNDQTESEIRYWALTVPDVEPVADPGPGPDCGFTDIVDSGAEDPVLIYYDANGNVLVRFRLGNAVDNSKGYSLLIDTDEKFGFTGAGADPNAVAGNPGFEIEIVLRTNFGVSLYDVDGNTNPVLKTTLAFDNYAQKSVALTRNCGDADYFYDFFIPFSTVTAHFPSVTTSTPLRIVAVTSMNPAPAIGNSAVSDVGGIDDRAAGYNYDNIFQNVVNNFTPTSIIGLGSGTSKDRSACPAITGPVASSATMVSGTSTEVGAIIKIYKGTSEPLPLIGTTTVSAAGTWTATVSAVSTGDVISATATNTAEGESYNYCSQITVTNCTTPISPYNLARESNRKYISGVGTPGGTIKVYTLASGVYTQVSGSFTLDGTGTGSFCWVPNLNTNTCSPPNGSGLLVNGTTYYVSQTVNGCESAKAPVCVDNQVSASPTLTQTSISTTTTTLSGTSGSGASITIYSNGTSIATTTASGTSWSVTVNLSARAGEYITVGAIEGSKCIAIQFAAPVLVTAVSVSSSTPAITGTYCATSTGTSRTIAGTSNEAEGTGIIVYANGSSIGTTTVYNGTWSLSATIKAGDVLTATATAAGKIVSAVSPGVTVGTSNAAPSVTFTSSLIEGAGSLSGTFSGSGTLKLYIDGLLLGSTTANSFTLSGLSGSSLYAGGVLTATLTVGSACESAHTAGATVSCSLPSSSLLITPAAQSVCSGSTSEVTVNNSENGIIYQLFNSASAWSVEKLGNGGNIVFTSHALSATATLTVKAMKISPVACAVTLSNTQVVTASQTITNNTITSPIITAFCGNGDPEELIGSLPEGGTGSFSYQWQVSTDNVTYSPVVGANSANYNPGVLPQTTYFKRTVTSGPCQTTTSTAVMIAVENTTLSNAILPTTSTAFNDNGTPSINGDNAGPGVTYIWQSSPDNINFTDIGVTSEDYTGSSIATPTYFRRIATNGSCFVISNVVGYSINASPVVTDFSKNGIEDTPVAFDADDFISHYNDANGNAIVHIVIETLPSKGVLQLAGNILTAGANVLAGDLDNLIFIPENDFNGAASFSWRAYDGAAYSGTATTTVEVSAVNDMPTGSDTAVSGVEDIIYAFAVTDFSNIFTDADMNPFAGIRIVGLPAVGALKLNGGDIAPNDAISSSDLTAGLLTFMPALNANAAPYTTFTFQVFDGTSYSASDYTLTINIAPVNDAPSFVKGADQTHMVGEGSISIAAWATNILAGPPDESSQALTFIGSNDNPSLFSVQPAISVSGQLTYTLATSAVGTASVFVKISDDGGTANNGLNESPEQAFTINVSSPANTPPVADDDIVSIAENTVNGTTVHAVAASDVDGDNLLFTIVNGNSAGAFAINGTTGVITVANQTLLDYEITTQFILTVRVSDGVFHDNATITINITDVNDNPPAASGGTVSIDEHALTGTAVYTVAGTDADGNSLSYSIVTGNSSGGFVINPATGAITVANGSALDFETTPQIILTVRVSDGVYEKDVLVTINLTNLNDNPPVAAGATVFIDENTVNGTPVYTVVGTDADNDPVQYSIIVGNSNGAFSIDPNTGEITVSNQVQLDYEGGTQYLLTVRVTDGVHSTDVTITVNLNDLNDNNPVAHDATVTIDEHSPNGTAVHTVSGSDADGNALTYSIAAGNDDGIFSINSIGGQIMVSDAVGLDYETHPQFILTVQVTDGISFSNATVTVNVNNINDNAPDGSDASVSINENLPFGSVVYTVVGSDIDGNTLTYALTGGNTGGAFSVNFATGVITVSNASQLDFESTPQFVLSIRISDGVHEKYVVVTVNLINLNDHAPIAANAIQNLNENVPAGTLVYTIAATDPDGNALTYQITDGNALGVFSINPLTGEITVGNNLNLDYEAVLQFVLEVTVSDGTYSTVALLTINVNNLNDNSPIATGGTTNIDENTSNGTPVYTVVASDPDGGSLAFAITGGNAAGAFIIDPVTGIISVADGTKLDFETTQQFNLTVRVSDGASYSDVTVTININNLNDNAPVSADATVTINENTTDGTSIYTVAATHADGLPLTYAISNGNTGNAFNIDPVTGIITVADGSQLNYESTTQFVLEITVTDGTNMVTVYITIHLVNLNDNSPVAQDASVSIDENSTNGTIVHAVAGTDADGDVLAYSIADGNGSNAFAIDPQTGVITVTDGSQLDREFISQFILTVNVSDGLHTAQVVITIQLNGTNDNAPVSADATLSADENSSNGTVVHAVVATDADGDNLTYAISSGNSSGAFTIDAATGVITVADVNQLDYESTTQFVLTITISDGTNAVTITVVINLNNQNDNAPVASDATVVLVENSAVGTPVHSVTANDADMDALTYSVVSGNNDDAFRIDPVTGVITVSEQSALDFEITPQFILTIQVTDGVNSTTAIVTVTLTDVPDNVSAIHSTIAANPTTVVADGVSVSTITVTLRDDQNVLLPASAGTLTLSTTLGVLSSVVDNNDGTYNATISSNITGTSTITASINNITLNSSATVVFTPRIPDATMTLITASPTSIVANGTSTSTITVQLRDNHSANVTTGGATVVLNTTSGTLGIVTDNGNGTYTAVLTSSTVAGLATITGAVNGDAIADDATVTFTPVIVIPVLTATISSDLNSIAADGKSTATITISVRDQDNVGITGAAVTVHTTAGSLGEVIDNGDGTYQSVLTSATLPAEAIITCTLNGNTNPNSVTVTFTVVPSAFFIPEGFSPDGDGFNDTFVITGADDFIVTLKVFNRWGEMVYEAKAYKNDWDGLANRGVVMGEKLPDGTYFYAVDLNNGEKPYVRYLTIKRK